jgi:hypothetical protein
MLDNIDLTEIKDKIVTYSKPDCFNIDKTLDYLEFYTFCYKYDILKGDISKKLFNKDLTLSEDNDSEDGLDDNAVQSSRRNSTRKKSRKDLKNEQCLTDIYMKLEERKILYSEYYPFIIDDGTLKVKNNLSNKQKLYISFIICSNLNYIDSCQSSFTSSFEKVTYFALTNLFNNANFNVKAMSTKLNNIPSYKGTARKKIIDLANELGLIPIHDNIKKVVNPRNTQEEGVDFVGWLDYGDNIKNTLIFLIQATCGKNIRSKAAEPLDYKDFIHFNTDPVITLTIPFHTEGTESVKKAFVLSRYKLLKLIDDQDFTTMNFSHLQSTKILNKLQSSIGLQD